MKMAVGITEEDIIVDRKDRMRRRTTTEIFGSELGTRVKEIRVGVVEIEESTGIRAQEEHGLILCSGIEPFSYRRSDRVLSRVAARELLMVGGLRAVDPMRIVQVTKAEQRAVMDDAVQGLLVRI